MLRRPDQIDQHHVGHNVLGVEVAGNANELGQTQGDGLVPVYVRIRPTTNVQGFGPYPHVGELPVDLFVVKAL